MLFIHAPVMKFILRPLAGVYTCNVFLFLFLLSLALSWCLFNGLYCFMCEGGCISELTSQLVASLSSIPFSTVNVCREFWAQWEISILGCFSDLRITSIFLFICWISKLVPFLGYCEECNNMQVSLQHTYTESSVVHPGWYSEIL